MLASVTTKEEKNTGITSRMILLRNILERLARIGHFQKCVLSDEKGMVISEFGEKALNKDTISAMFALMHNVVERTVRNLEMEGPYVVMLQSSEGFIFTTTFRIPRYERTLILTAFSDSNGSSQEANTVFKGKPPSSPLMQIRTALGTPSFLKSILNSLTSTVLRYFKPAKRKIQAHQTPINVDPPVSSCLASKKIKILTESINELKNVL